MKFFAIIAIAAVIVAGTHWYARRRVAAAPPEPVAPEAPVAPDEASRPNVTPNAAGGRVR